MGREMSLTRIVAALVFALAIALCTDACRRIVDLTPDSSNASDATSSVDTISFGSGSDSGIDFDAGFNNDGGGGLDAGIPPDA